MPSFDEYVNRLRQADRGELESLTLAASISHATICQAASSEPEPHASSETMASRIREMSTDDLARALAPYAAVADLAQEPHHAGHQR